MPTLVMIANIAATGDVAAPHLRMRIHGRAVLVTAHASGRIRLTVDGRMTHTKRLAHGRVSFRLPRLAPGRHRMKAVYLGKPRVSVHRTFSR